MPDLLSRFSNDQLLFHAGALFLILFLLINAFKVGFLAQLWNFIVFPVSIAIGRYVYENSPVLLDALVGTNPGVISQSIVGVIAGILSLVVLKKFGFALFSGCMKKIPIMAKCESPGMFSAVLSLIPAFLLILLLAFVARFIGLADETEFIDKRMGRRPGETLAPKPGMTKLRDSLDRGPIGAFMNEFDWWASDGHRNLMYLLMADAHFNEDINFYIRHQPKLDRLWASRGLVRLRQDKEIRTLIRDRRYLKLLGHKKVAAIVWDPDYRDLLKSIDMRKVLKRALE